MTTTGIDYVLIRYRRSSTRLYFRGMDSVVWEGYTLGQMETSELYQFYTRDLRKCLVDQTSEISGVY